MNNSIERELKMLLTREEYERLCAAFPADEIIEQTNTYYDDSNNTVTGLNGALRLRKTPDQNILTIKLPHTDKSKYEYETVTESESLLHPSQKDLDFIADHMNLQIPLNELVTLTTIRKIHRFPNGELCLDQSTYYGQTDYELEYEYSDNHDGVEFLNSLLKPYDLTYEKNCRSKLTRAVREKTKSKN